MNEVICPPYEVTEELTTGHLYKAIDPTTGEIVVIRVVRVGKGSRSNAGLLISIQMWRDAMLPISHPHIARIIDVKYGEAEVFIISEWCDGHSLRSLLGAHREIAHPLVDYYMQQVAAGLDYLHEKGLFHRDFTLQRVLVDPTGTAKLIEVGLPGIVPSVAKQGGLEGVERGYISPQELLGQGPSAQADLFRFAVGCYELIVGDIPFRGNTPEELRQSILRGTPTPPTLRSRNISKSLNKVFEMALSANPNSRPATATQLVKPLSRSNSRYSGTALMEEGLLHLRETISTKSRRTRSVVVMGIGALLGITIMSSTLGRNIISHIISIKRPPSMTQAPQPTRTPATNPKGNETPAANPITQQALTIAARGTGGEKDLVSILRSLYNTASAPSSPLSKMERQLLRTLITHDNPGMRAFVIRIIEERNGTELGNELVARLSDGDAGVRTAAVRALQATGYPVSVKTLALRAASESNPAVHSKIMQLAQAREAETADGKVSGR